MVENKSKHGENLRNILITGGTGFIARSLISLLLSEGWNVHATVREKRELDRLPSSVTGLVTGNLELTTDWKPFLEKVEIVIHLAARVHRMSEDKSEAVDAYQRINVGVTEALANASSWAGVRRFIFISSVKAMGECTQPGEAWSESSPCFPQDDYGRSKYEAEKVLVDIGKKTNLEVVILRLPLVYGPGVKANMARLIRTVDRGFPLPLGAIHNKRSLLYVTNLVDAIRVSLDHPAAAGETFLISDGEDRSTPELIRLIGRTLDRPARMIDIPPSIIRLAGRVLGKGAEVERLLGSLVIDIGKIRRTLSWNPPYTMEQGLKQTVHWCMAHESAKSV